MINPVQRLPLLLRLTLLGLVVLGVLIKPAYSTWCETHQLGHQLATLSHERFRPDSNVEKQLDRDHARGAHGLLHGSDDGGVYADLTAVVVMPPVVLDSVLNPQSMLLPIPVQHVTKPFRPPIA